MSNLTPTIIVKDTGEKKRKRERTYISIQQM